jgi:mannitol-1-phosphate 5-dehydrogenase
MESKKMVLFGAGKIGRSFIGQVFSSSGYEVVFIDINRELIDRLNRAKQYKVLVKSEKGVQVINIENVRGVSLTETSMILEELAGASIAALSVGQQGLPAVIPLLAKALILRWEKYGKLPLDIIIAENMRNADDYIRQELLKILPADFPAGELLGLVETSIGKMVPLMTIKDYEEDPLQVFAEPYNTLIVSKKGFKNPIPPIRDLSPKENIKAWVDCKLFIHNLGHATAAYLGHKADPSAIYIYEVLENYKVHTETLETMLQSAAILEHLYPGEFASGFLIDHINDLLSRFMNKALGDTIFRVGCDLYRKLGPDDRLAGPIHAALKSGLPYNLILNSIEAAIYFRAKDENGKYHVNDERFFVETKKGIDYVLKEICKLKTHN